MEADPTRRSPTLRVPRTLLLPVAVLALVAPFPARAQALPPDTLALTLAAAVDRGVSLSEEVRWARAGRLIADGQVTQARAGALPQVTSALGYNRTLASIFDDLVMAPPPDDEEDPGFGDLFEGLPFGRPNTWTASLQVTQPLYSGGRVGTGLAIAHHVRRAADLEVEEAEAEIALQVRTAYFQAVLAAEFVAIAREAYELATAQLEQVELFRRQGTASEFDVLRARVERDNLEPSIIEATNARRLAELNLKRIINVPAEQPLALVTPLDPRLLDVDGAALRAALDRRPALGALEAVVAAREGAVRIARAARLPTVGLAGTFAYQAFPRSVAPSQDDWRRDWMVGVQMSLPVFTGFRVSGQVEQARAELERARLQRDQARQGMELELEAALGEFAAARAQIEARQATVGQARRTLELAELRFRSGLATQLDVSAARLLLEQARVNEAQSLFNYMSALARLERVSGGEIPLVEERLPAGNRTGG
jgi:outer membrane protein